MGPSCGGVKQSNPSAVSWGGNRLDVFARGTDDGLWHGWTHGGTNQFGWESLGGYITSSPVAAARAPNRIDVFVRGGEGGMWRAAWEGAGWFWVPHGGYIHEGPFMAATTFSNLQARLGVWLGDADRLLQHQVEPGAPDVLGRHQQGGQQRQGLRSPYNLLERFLAAATRPDVDPTSRLRRLSGRRSLELA